MRILALALLVACVVSSSGDAFGAAAAIDDAERLDVDGARLFLLTRGDDRSAPVILWLHGGPGGAERPLFRYFNGELEEHFVVVYYDQRGAGRSFDPEADPQKLTVARHLTDLDAVVDHLRNELGARKITLVGHSWGAALGLLYAQAHPEKVSAIVAVAPLISTRASQQQQYEFVEAEALRRQDDDVLARLRQIGAPPHESAAEVLAMERLADGYGAVFHHRPGRIGPLLGSIVRGFVTAWEIPRLIRGNEVSLDAMNDELIDLDLTHSVSELDVPVIFMLGRYDRHVGSEIAAAYLAVLRAPVKKVFWFEHSSHNVPFEEPDRFDATIRAELMATQLGVVAGCRRTASVRSRLRHAGSRSR